MGVLNQLDKETVVAFAPLKNSMIKHEHDTFKIECMGDEGLTRQMS
jgi:hypothetical protein